MGYDLSFFKINKRLVMTITITININSKGEIEVISPKATTIVPEYDLNIMQHGQTLSDMSFGEFASRVADEPWLAHHKRGKHIRSMLAAKLAAGRGDKPAYQEIPEMRQRPYIGKTSIDRLMHQLSKYEAERRV